ncbi:MAG: YgfZ/GcvT domain-containing protein, partial [Candidatus Binataceae bacterium]
MCSNDIKSMSPGDVAPGLFLTERAHIIADFFIWACTDSFLIEIGRALWTPARDHLEKFLVADDVEFEELTTLDILELEGSTAAAALTPLFLDASELQCWRFITSDDVMIANFPRFGALAFTLLAERDKLAAITAKLRAAATPELDPDALNAVRIEHGLARIAVDTDEKTLAVEARLDRAISLTKGCYIGQETIERATAHGSLKKKLFGLRLSGGRAPESGAPVMMEGKQVGRLTSYAVSARLGGIALAILHHSAWEPGTAVIIKDQEGELPATVSDLPFI